MAGWPETTMALAQHVPAVGNASISPQLSHLLSLARNPSSDARQRLMLGVVALGETCPPSAEVSPVLGEILMTLARQAETAIRRELAQRLAHAEWAPVALVNILALDEIEIARPVLESSPLLHDEHLLRVLYEASREHQIAVASRPSVSTRVTDAVIEQADPAVLVALATNSTARFSPDGLRRLVEHSRQISELRCPLTRHPLLTEALAEELFQWVGTALREAIADRFRVDATTFGAAVHDAVRSVMGLDTSAGTLAVPDELDEAEGRLVEKLQQSGQLRASVLVRAIRENRLSLFAFALAALSGISVSRIRAAMAAPSPEALYYACTAVGIDRAVFPSLLDDLRKLNGFLPGDQGELVWQRGAISERSAARAFTALIAE
jgi:uncharacterized protein (DUF2336 family)